MLNLDQSESYPQFVVKYKDQTHKFDPLLLGEKLEGLDTNLDNSTKVLQVIEELTGFEGLNALQAFDIIAKFYAFVKDELDAAVKNVLGRSLFSDTTTESEETNIENSNEHEEPSSSD